MYLNNNNCLPRAVPENIARGLSGDRACEVFTMTEGNIFSTAQGKQLLLFLLKQNNSSFFHFDNSLMLKVLMIEK